MRARRVQVVRATTEKIEIFVPPRWSESWRPYRIEGTLIRGDKTGRALRLYISPRTPQPASEESNS